MRELRAGAVLVQPRHGKPVIARDVFRVIHSDQTIGIAWISNHEHAHIGCSIFLDRLTLSDKNLAVNPQQVLAFHAGLARNTPDQQRPVHIAKTLVEISRWYH